MPATLLPTDALADALTAAVAEGVPIETAVAAAGIAPRAFLEWFQAADRGAWRDGQPVEPATLERLTRFSHRVALAQAMWEAERVKAITQDAARVNEKTGQRVWRARSWLVNNHPRTGQTYHEAFELEAPRQDAFAELEWASSLSDDELLAEQAKLI
jgi:hypothetical protein